jgi:hypothetical protein
MLRRLLRRVFRRRRLPAEDDDYGWPYGAGHQQLDPDLWEYGRESGWW